MRNGRFRYAGDGGEVGVADFGAREGIEDADPGWVGEGAKALGQRFGLVAAQKLREDSGNRVRVVEAVFAGRSPQAGHAAIIDEQLLKCRLLGQPFLSNDALAPIESFGSLGGRDLRAFWLLPRGRDSSAGASE